MSPQHALEQYIFLITILKSLSKIITNLDVVVLSGTVLYANVVALWWFTVPVCEC